MVLSADRDVEAIETHRHHFGGLTLDWDLSDPATSRRSPTSSRTRVWSCSRAVRPVSRFRGPGGARSATVS